MKPTRCPHYGTHEWCTIARGTEPRLFARCGPASSRSATTRAKAERDGTQKKDWGEHVRGAVAALAAADAALDDITGWSGGGGNWPAQEAHPRVQAALVLLRGKYGDDPRVDAFLAELAKVPK